MKIPNGISIRDFLTFADAGVIMKKKQTRGECLWMRKNKNLYE